jgi:hypothetical protein
MKKLVVLSLVAIGAAIPAVASAHTLSGNAARAEARAICQAINEVSSDVNPYACRRTGAPRRRSPHTIDVGLSLRDPNDGERCTAFIRVRLSSRSNRRSVFEHRHSCQANPYAGL